MSSVVSQLNPYWREHQRKDSGCSWPQASKCWRSSDPDAAVLPKVTSTPFLTLAYVACRSHPRKVILPDAQIQREHSQTRMTKPHLGHI